MNRFLEGLQHQHRLLRIARRVKRRQKSRPVLQLLLQHHQAQPQLAHSRPLDIVLLSNQSRVNHNGRLFFPRHRRPALFPPNVRNKVTTISFCAEQIQAISTHYRKCSAKELSPKTGSLFLVKKIYPTIARGGTHNCKVLG